MTGSQQDDDLRDAPNPDIPVATTSFRRLLPAGTGPRVVSTERLFRRQRQTVPAACLECRRRKVKCSATRPICSRCSIQNVECEWDTEPETTRRRAIVNRLEELEKENNDLHELIRDLSSRPEAEANEIFNRLRATGDAFHVLDLVRVGDLLLGRQPNEAESSSERRTKSSPVSSKSNSVKETADMNALHRED
ncbi:hypothetical protein CORC01_06039 [Colletotrichum orchidophilum]|uniref:Zn(2)-C6 fungal-type domain-containing protein n=1 Tax=Colletotrichum orchidophilum TaxID=1209926 RepID=A0A1G4BB33_9PEZI|nr:uncharacterized protein CORC01_06039 [Colletotrichum orchidophilum]OHE98588.1 hypothetical protein CORC01_06039 [Colletotrichum orchidophilum]